MLLRSIHDRFFGLAGMSSRQTFHPPPKKHWKAFAYPDARVPKQFGQFKAQFSQISAQFGSVFALSELDNMEPAFTRYNAIGVGNMTQQERISEIVLKLKQIREERNLTIHDIYDLVCDSGGYLSLSSVKRVFSEGSENQHFRYHDTIQPIVRALLGVNEETPENNDITANEIDALKNVILLKDSIIVELEKEKNALSTKNNALEENLQTLRDENQRKVDYLLEQIKRLRQEIDDWRKEVGSWHAENERKAKIIDKFLESKDSATHPIDITMNTNE